MFEREVVIDYYDDLNLKDREKCLRMVLEKKSKILLKSIEGIWVYRGKLDRDIYEKELESFIIRHIVSIEDLALAAKHIIIDSPNSYNYKLIKR